MSDDDYMSNNFLNVKEDIRPGLTHSKSTKRKYEIEKKKNESNKFFRTKSRKELEDECRSTGLETALTAENKGFAMLQKMGYKPGMKLGPQKDNVCDSGLKEPIKVKLKVDRGGLGREEEIRTRIKEREQKKIKIKVWKEKETERLTEEFRERMKNKVVYNHLVADLSKSQKVCQQLDAENDIKEPMRPWFWYYFETTEEEDEVEEEIEEEEQLNFILDYLRCKYYYCLWCGVKYNDEDDMTTNCPGTEKGDHDE